MSSDKQNINKISKEIVSLAASKATLAVPGVNQEKDIRLSRDKEGFVIDIFVTVDFGSKIPQLAWDIQNSVKEAVETITQQTVKAVNIHVQGVMMPQEGKRTDE
ncbi:MAG: Asp23/Gls24 family envelope stress response protein [Firmicutes bacterium]|nr:Asp23/Gls24 family envelope stress response protein [Bacillota bacterium]